MNEWAALGAWFRHFLTEPSVRRAQPALLDGKGSGSEGDAGLRALWARVHRDTPTEAWSTAEEQALALIARVATAIQLPKRAWGPMLIDLMRSSTGRRMPERLLSLAATYLASYLDVIQEHPDWLRALRKRQGHEWEELPQIARLVVSMGPSHGVAGARAFLWACTVIPIDEQWVGGAESLLFQADVTAHPDAETLVREWPALRAVLRGKNAVAVSLGDALVMGQCFPKGLEAENRGAQARL